jgi:phage head maturation protease
MILTRAVDVADLEVRSDGRTIEGTILVYGEQAHIVEYGQRYVETFTRGAFAGTDPTSVVLTAKHPRSSSELPIGVSVEFDDGPAKLRGAWHVSDIELGNEVLQLAHDKVPLSLSVGFVEVPGGSRWNHTRTHVERHKAALDHVAVVRAGAYPSARVTGVRGSHEVTARPLLLAALRRNP